MLNKYVQFYQTPPIIHTSSTQKNPFRIHEKKPLSNDNCNEKDICIFESDQKLNSFAIQMTNQTN